MSEFILFAEVDDLSVTTALEVEYPFVISHVRHHR